LVYKKGIKTLATYPQKNRRKTKELANVLVEDVAGVACRKVVITVKWC